MHLSGVLVSFRRLHGVTTQNTTVDIFTAVRNLKFQTGYPCSLVNFILTMRHCQYRRVAGHVGMVFETLRLWIIL